MLGIRLNKGKFVVEFNASGTDQLLHSRIEIYGDAYLVPGEPIQYGSGSSAQIYRTSFRENKRNTLVFND
jgi:hypothetical protein